MTEISTATTSATLADTTRAGGGAFPSAAVAVCDSPGEDAARQAALDRVALLLPTIGHAARHRDPLDYAVAFVEHYPNDVVQLEREWDFLRGALELACRRERRAAALRIAAALAYPAGRRPRPAEGERVLRLGIEAARQLGDRRQLGMLVNRLGGLRFAHGRYRQGWRLWRAGLDLDRASPGQRLGWWAPAMSFATCVDLLGRFGHGQELGDQLGTGGDDEDDELLAVTLFVRGFQAHRRGRLDHAYDDISAALRLCAGSPRPCAGEMWHVLSLTMQTELARLHGDHTRARDAAATAAALARVAGDAYTWAALITDQALYAYSHGWHDESLTLLRALDQGPPGADSLPIVIRGRRFRALYRAEAASACPAVTTALAVASPAGPASAASSTRLLRLSTRETDVLRLVAAGHSTHAIAARLAVTPATVKKHLEHVYTRLDAHSRTAAVAAARALGLLP